MRIWKMQFSYLICSFQSRLVLLHTHTIFFFCFLILNSCIQKEQLPENIVTDVVTGIPLFNTDVTVSDLVKGNEEKYKISTNSDGFYSINIGPDTFDFPTAENIIKLKDQQFSDANSNTILLISLNQTVEISKDFEFDSDFYNSNSGLLQGADIREIIIKAGEIGISATKNGVTNKVSIGITFPALKSTSDNSSLSINLDLNSTGSKISTTSISGYKLTLSPGVKFTINVKVKMEAGTLGNSGSLVLNYFAINGLKWRKLTGELGTLNYQVGSENGGNSTKSIPVNPFSSDYNNGLNTSVLGFKNPKVSINLASTFGVPIELKMEKLLSKDKDGNVLKYYPQYGSPLPSANFVRPIDIDGNVFPSNQPWNISSDIINDLISATPNNLEFSMLLKTNTLGIASTSLTDYIYDNSNIKAISKIEIPLSGYINNMTFQTDIKTPDGLLTTFSFSGGNIEPKEAFIKIKYDNGFPFGADISASILDKDNKAIYVILTGENKKFQSGEVDYVTGKVEKSTSGEIVSKILNIATYNRIAQNARLVRFDIIVNTYQAPDVNVKIGPNDKLKLSLSAFGKGKAILNTSE